MAATGNSKVYDELEDGMTAEDMIQKGNGLTYK